MHVCLCKYVHVFLLCILSIWMRESNIVIDGCMLINKSPTLMCLAKTKYKYICLQWVQKSVRTRRYASENKLSHTYKRSYFFPLLSLCACVFRHVLWFCFWLWVWWHHSIQFWEQVILFATLAHKALHGQVPCQHEVLQYNLCQHLPSLSTHKHKGLLKKGGGGGGGSLLKETFRQ